MKMDTIEDRDPIADYWATHRKQLWLDLRDEFGRTMDQVEFAHTDGWVNGRYAAAAVVWGLILMLVWSLSI